MTAFALKMIAIITMFIDHFGYFINNGKISVCNYIGRIAFPIFAFQISQGYIHTSNLKQYFKRLFVFALISQIPFFLYFHTALHFNASLNIFFTLFLGLLCIYSYDKLPSKLFAIPIIAIICYIGEILKVDYGYWGILLIFMFYFTKDNKVLMSILFLVMCLIKYLIPSLLISSLNIQSILLALLTFVSIIPMLLYNGKLGPKTKKLLYIFYPGHLLLLYIATLL